MQNEITPSIDRFNAALPDIARRANATFLPLPAMPSPHTIDGIHLNADGYRIWDKAVMQGATIVPASRSATLSPSGRTTDTVRPSATPITVPV